MNQDRQTRIAIDLGDDRVVLERIHGQEAMSTLFSYVVEIRSPLEIDMEPHMGKPAAIAVTEDGALQRHFNGLVVSSEFLSQSAAGCQYRLILRPWLFWLAQNRNMAMDLSPKIRVNAISPGSIMTSALDMVLQMPEIEQAMIDATPLGRLGTVDDIAAAAVYLASDAGAYVTGRDIRVDGGIEASNLEMPIPDL